MSQNKNPAAGSTAHGYKKSNKYHQWTEEILTGQNGLSNLTNHKKQKSLAP
jgi:hypothetical protein